MQPAQSGISHEEYLLFFTFISIWNPLQSKLCVCDRSFSLILAIKLHLRRFTEILNGGFCDGEEDFRCS